MRGKPEILPCGSFVDDRGALSFLNTVGDFNLKRLYVISNHKRDYVRAWHGHEHEEKIFFPVTGSFLIGAVPIDNFQDPDTNIVPTRKILSELRIEGYRIPPGYANGIMSLTENSKLLVLSNSTLDQSKEDDYRYPWNTWNIWDISSR